MRPGSAESKSNGAEELHTSDDASSTLEPIAIIGMAFELPQGATTDEAFWDMLVQKKCASQEYPPDRMNIDAFYDTTKKRMNSMHTRKAHFLERDIYDFDAPFFSVSAQDAMAMDPCQRTLMETTYHAFESAGLTLDAISGTDTSVHVGCFSSDYMLSAFRDPQAIPKYSASGISSAMLANRLSWFYDLRGPSLTLDTACSSGMVALDLACQGLWSRRSSMAVVAASNLILTPELNISLSHMNFLSPDGRCFSFDHRANGYARGEGVATLILAPLSKAIALGAPIRALIRSVCSNQDGRTPGGITQPSKNAQAKLIEETYRKARLDMKHTRFFEAHGTGTSVGDPTEATAIGECFWSHRTDGPLYVGAVKSNTGHLEGTSGLAGVIKAVLAIERSTIPPNTNFERLNPSIDAEFLRLHFPQESIPWPSSIIKRASVNSFGFGGSNCHVVLDDLQSYLGATKLMLALMPSLKADASASQSSDHWRESFTPQLLIFSARDKEGIDRQVQAHQEHLGGLSAKTEPEYFHDYSYTLAVHRTKHSWNSFCVIKDPGDLAPLQLQSPIPRPSTSSSRILGLVFTGQGAQWAGMGHELMRLPVFLKSIEESQACLSALGCPWSVFDYLSPGVDGSTLAEARFGQVLTTVVQLALVDLLEWVKITPNVVVGHSSGEIAAAYSAGYLSRAGAVQVSYFRGLLGSQLEKQPGPRHGMAAIGLSEQEAMERTAQSRNANGSRNSSLVISCVNSPSNVTISGISEEVEALVSDLTSQGVFARMLKVKLGYHSPQMAAISAQYRQALDSLQPRPGLSKSGPVMVSSVTGQIVDQETVCEAEYWVQNMISKVDFLGAIGQCYATSAQRTGTKRLGQKKAPSLHAHAWMEVGPHAALKGPLREILTSVTAEAIPYTSALVRGECALASALAATGRLHCHYFPVDLARVTSFGLTEDQLLSRRPLPNLPAYRFDHTTKYVDQSSVEKMLLNRNFGPHSLLGLRTSEGNDFEAQWRILLKVDDLPWVVDHRVNGMILYPAAGMLVMAIEALYQLHPSSSHQAVDLKDVDISSPIAIPTDGHVEVRTYLSCKDLKAATHQFRIISSKGNEPPEIVCQGTIRILPTSKNPFLPSRADQKRSGDLIVLENSSILDSCESHVDHRSWYESFRTSTELEYGPAFQRLRSIRYDSQGHAVAKLLPFEAVEPETSVVHPTELDSTFQLCFAALGGIQEVAKTMVPTRIGRLRLTYPGDSRDSPGRSLPDTVTVSALDISRRNAAFDIKAFGRTSDFVLDVDGLELTAVSGDGGERKTLDDAPFVCSHMQWEVDLDLLTDDETQAFCEEARKETSDFSDHLLSDLEDIAMCMSKDVISGMEDSEICSSMKKYATWLRSKTENIPEGKVAPEMPSSARLDLTVKIAKQLRALLRGEVDPLQVVFEDDVLINNFYREAMQDSSYLPCVSRYLQCIVHKNPRVKILEVGAGTGGTTMEILKATADERGNAFEEYTFTDISPAFLERGQQTFASYSRMNYRVLDIEKDPVAQGFTESSYDIVVADNVLHATRSLDETLSNARRLLKPGGKLIFRELRPESLMTGFIFGILPGWWRSVEEERHMSPCLSTDQWDRYLRRCGFSGVHCSFKDHLDPGRHQNTFIISSATAAEAPKSAVQAPLFVAQPGSWTNIQMCEDVANLLPSGVIPEPVSLENAASVLEREPHRHDIILFDCDQKALLSKLEESTFRGLKTVLSLARSVLWVKWSSPDYCMSDGLCRVSRYENSKTTLIGLALETPASSKGAAHIVNMYKSVQEHLLSESSEIEPEYVEMEGRLCINRLRGGVQIDRHIFRRTGAPAMRQTVGSRPLRIGIRTPGLLDTIEFYEEDDWSDTLDPNEVEMDVKAIGVNYKDLITLLGKTPSEELGCEYSGIVRAIGTAVKDLKIGDRVACTVTDLFQTRKRVHINNLVKLGDKITFAEAAALFVVGATAYHTLSGLAKLRPTETVLIHSAAGGTGQAAVQIAQWIGAEVYATVGDKTKRQLLMDKYKIPESHIFYSRDESFAEGVKRSTGQGVDVVLNSLAGPLLEASWDCIAPFGRFIDIGLKDAFLGGRLPMKAFLRNATFSSAELALVAKRKDQYCKDVLNKVYDLYEQGALEASYPLQTYCLGEMEAAFRYLQSGNSSGKMVLSVEDDEVVPVVQGRHSHYRFDEDATYIIVGGFGGIGRAIARWMVSRGARHLLILSRSGGKASQGARAFEAELAEKGVTTISPACDITEVESLASVLREYKDSMPPIKGCIQAAMVIRDITLSSMSLQDWENTIAPKVRGSWNLHCALPKGMDFFIMLSSCAGIFGNGGQANYASGNTYQDALARHRVASGEKAVSLDIGYVLQDGYVAEHKAAKDQLTRMGMLCPTTFEEIFAILDYYCQPQAQLDLKQSQVVLGFVPPADIARQQQEIPAQMKRPIFRHFFRFDAEDIVQGQSRDNSANSLKAALLSEPSEDTAGRMVTKALASKVAKVLGLREDQIRVESPLATYGIDSLVGIEIKNWLGRETGVDLPVFELLGGATLEEIGNTVAAKSFAGR
ncbi:hypothetical protein M011DRAFT_413522 [Sporormia fimetaria CBS 119925]|uniref:Uncharacterized protein n=1 Tax=Sporormia fimetaria CBS 119925 TaxID=1340428 RepID=A0A6A6UW14_9PLEO|nr:hypothetical protein M011DRAFT_413522 [Sporormia fimetaria CBS 119925]